MWESRTGNHNRRVMKACVCVCFVCICLRVLREVCMFACVACDVGVHLGPGDWSGNMINPCFLSPRPCVWEIHVKLEFTTKVLMSLP